MKEQTKALNIKKKAQQKQKALAAEAAEGGAVSTAEGSLSTAEGGVVSMTEDTVSAETANAAREAEESSLEKEMTAAKHKRRKLRALKALEEDDGVGVGKKQKEKIKLLASIMAQQFEKWDQDKTAQVREKDAGRPVEFRVVVLR